MSEALSVLALGLAGAALVLTLRTLGQLRGIESLTGGAGAVLGEMKQDFAEFELASVEHHEALTTLVDEGHETLAALARRQGISTEAIEDVEEEVAIAIEEREDPAGAYARMNPVTIEELPEDVLREIREGLDADPVWALRRRGGGHPRWLVGMPSGGPWRVTLRKEGPAMTEAPSLADKIRPVSVEDLEEEAVEALLEASGEDRSRLDDIVFRRATRGVPVYFAFLHPEEGPTQVWKLVRTRWGWRGAQEVPRVRDVARAEAGGSEQSLPAAS